MPKPWFTKGKYLYPEPERFTAAEARSRRLSQLLERERRFENVPNFSFVLARQKAAADLSRVAKKKQSSVPQGTVKGRLSRGPYAASIAAQLAGIHNELDWNDTAKVKKYRLLRQSQADSRPSKPTGGDKRHFDPTGKDHAATFAGTLARTTGVSNLLSAGWNPHFLRQAQVIPCVQRMVRKEVMFAKQKAGHGYHTKKRRNFLSGIPC